MKRTKTTRQVSGFKRVVKLVPVTRQVVQCERPYVLFGKAISTARRAQRITQQELADKLGVSRGSVANIEAGRQRILLTDLFVFAKALKLGPIKLFKEISRP